MIFTLASSRKIVTGVMTLTLNVKCLAAQLCMWEKHYSHTAVIYKIYNKHCVDWDELQENRDPFVGWKHDAMTACKEDHNCAGLYERNRKIIMIWAENAKKWDLIAAVQYF